MYIYRLQTREVAKGRDLTEASYTSYVLHSSHLAP